MFNPQKRRLWGDPGAFEFLKRAYEKEGDRLFRRALVTGHGVMFLN